MESFALAHSYVSAECEYVILSGCVCIVLVSVTLILRGVVLNTQYIVMLYKDSNKSVMVLGKPPSQVDIIDIA